MSLSHCKVCELEDFAAPELRDVIREVFVHELVRFGPEFPAGHEYRKYWEVAMAVRALRHSGCLHGESEVLGVGAGNEATLFVLTREARRVFATDRYLGSEGWEEFAAASMLTSPERHWPDEWEPRRLVVQHMDALDLRYDDGCMDAVFSSSSIEHFGDHAAIARALDEMYRVLKPGGVLSLSTELRLEGPPPGFPGVVLFDEAELREIVIGSHDWQPLSEPDFGVSPATRATELDFGTVAADQTRQHERLGGSQSFRVEYERYPHLVLRRGPHVFTSVHLALRKPG